MDRPGRTYRNRSPDSSFESEVESDSFAEATFVTVSESIGRSQGTAVLRKQSTPSLRSQYSDDDRSPLLSARTPMVGYSTVSTSPVRKSRPRLAFLDLIRGVLLIMMIMVNYQPSNKDKKFGWLSHVEWHGWSLADMVFPGLVGIMGVAIPLSLQARPRSAIRLTKRGLRLLAMGLMLNLPSVGLLSGRLEWSQYRYMGVLQRLSIAYTVTALAYAYLPWMIYQMVFPAAITLAWTYFTIQFANMPVSCSHETDLFFPPACTAEAYIDTHILGRSHLHQQLPYDPEGLLSALPSILSCWLGTFFGVILLRMLHHDSTDGTWRRKVVKVMCLLGVLFWLVHLGIVALGVPICKKLWTPSFVMIAWTVLCTALIVSFVAVELWDWQSDLVVAFGRNPLMLYVVSSVVQMVLTRVPLKGASLWSWIFEATVGTLPGGWSGFVWSVGWMGLVYLPIAKYLDEQNVYWKL